MNYDIVIGQEIIFTNKDNNKELGRIIAFSSSKNGIVDTIYIHPYMTGEMIECDVNSVTLIDPLIRWRSK
jgi:hypothetical protein